jgi:hypothetical protein
MMVRIVGVYQRTEMRGSLRLMLEESKSRTIEDFHPTKSGKIHVDDRDGQRAMNGEAQVNILWEKMVLVHLGMAEEMKDWEVCGSNPKSILKNGADEKEEPRICEV